MKELQDVLQNLENFGLLDDLKELRVGNVSFSLFRTQDPTHRPNQNNQSTGIDISSDNSDEEPAEDDFLETLLHSSRS
jgi:hypothetical protein